MDTQKQDWIDALKVQLGIAITQSEFDTAERITTMIERIYWMQDMETDRNNPDEES